MDSGWRLVKGAGGYSYWHDARKWITSVYATQAQAERAAETLETRARETLAAGERERDGLRRAFGDNHVS